MEDHCAFVPGESMGQIQKGFPEAEGKRNHFGHGAETMQKTRKLVHEGLP